ncbi:10065_t:CDS:2, partial [Funneliformis geosporum]
SCEDILRLLIASDELLLEELFKNVQEYLLEKDPSWIQQNYIFVLHTVKKSDLVTWNQKDFEALEKTLSQFIPLIRFTDISSIDFYDKIRPYKAIIPHHINEEITEFYYKNTFPKQSILPPRVSKLESTIIKPMLAPIIANWIDKKDSTILAFNNRYKFKLIYLKSRDGFDRTIFHEKCSGQGPFVTLIKTQSKKIYGGYNPIGYAMRINQWLTSSDSFIFSFENNQDIHNMNLYRVIKVGMSIRENYSGSYIINFGNCLYTNGSSLGINNCGSYNDINIDGNVNTSVDEIEVFSVIMK